jgi:hypothetical protein
VGWGYECSQHRDLLIAMGPDRRHPVKARTVRAPINPSVSKGCTEVEPSCSASVSSSRRDRRRNRTARLLQRRRLQQHRWLLGLEPVDHVGAHQSMGRIWSARAHTRSGRSFRLHSENTRCATGVRRRGHPRFTASEISRHSNCEPACAIRCTAQTPPVGIVQHVGSPIARVRVTRAAGGGPLASLSRRRRRPGGGFWHVVLDAMLPDRIAFLFQRCGKRRDVPTLR